MANRAGFGHPAMVGKRPLQKAHEEVYDTNVKSSNRDFAEGNRNR